MTFAPPLKVFLPGAGARMIPALRSVAGVGEIIVSLNDPFAAGNFLADRSYHLPRFSHPDFAAGFEAVLEREHFDVCLPVLDSALVFFSRHFDRYRACGFRLAMNNPSAVGVATDKLCLQQLLEKCGLPVAPMWTFEEFLERREPLQPAFLKPRFPEQRDFGTGFYARLDDDADLSYWSARLRGRPATHIVQPLLAGCEHNIDFFCDENSIVRSLVVIRRLRGEPGGAISCGEIVEDARFDEFAQAVAAATGLWGSNQLQAFVGPGDDLRFTDLNVRLNGSSPFVKAAGIDHFDNLFRLIRGEPLAFPPRPRPLRMTQWEQPHYFTSSPLREIAFPRIQAVEARTDPTLVTKEIRE